MNRFVLTVTGVLSLGLAVMTSAMAANYTLQDLGDLDGYSCFPHAVNESAQVAGYCFGSNGEAFFWHDGKARYLGTPGSECPAYAMNDQGQVVGSARMPDGFGQAYLWGREGLEVLGTLGGHSSEARGINNLGQVVGDADIARTDPLVQLYHAFLWDEAKGMLDLGTLDGLWSEAMAINDAGQVVGGAYSPDAPGNYQAFIWDSANGMRSLGAGMHSARGINNMGQVIGWGASNRAFLWDAVNGTSVLQPLHGSAESSACGINDSGQIVGYSGLSFPTRATIWEDGIPADLNALTLNLGGWQLNGCSAINNKGQIIGYGSVNGDIRGFILTPVPEPSSILALLCGIGGLAWRRTRH